MDGVPNLVPVSYEQFVADVHALVAALAASGWRPDMLVGIGRGGLAPALWLSHATDLPMLSVDHSAGESDFADALVERIARRAATGERFLFVDDINDSGRTIASLRGHLPDIGDVRFAVLIDNRTSLASADFSARTIDRATDKSWFVFPWEALASRETLVADAEAVSERLSPVSARPAPPT